MQKFIYPTLIFMLAAGGACAAQSDQPSLGDLAKQTRQEKKVVKVLTNDDVATVTPQVQYQASKTDNVSSTATSSSEADAVAKTPAKAKEAEKTAAAPKDPPEVAELKQKLTSYKQQQEGWKQSAKKYEDLMANEKSEFRRQMYEDALEGDKKNIEIFQEKIDQTQADLAKAEKPSSSSH